MKDNIQNNHKKYLLKKKLLKISLKFFLISLILTIAIWVGVTLSLGKGKTFFLNLIASNLLNIDVKPAVVTGITSKGLKYNITSETIENYIANYFYKSNIDFAKPTVKLELENGNIVNIGSKTGEFDEAKNLFYLKNKVELLSSDGAYLESSLITLDISDSKIYTNEKTVAIDNGNYLYSKGFTLYDQFNKLTVYGPVVVSDLKISDSNLYNKDIFSKIYFRTTGDIEVDNISKIIKSNHPFFGFKDQVKYSANSFNAKYLELGSFKNTENTLENFTRIEMLENVKIYNSASHGVTTGDKYVYDVVKGIMIITSKEGNTKYEDTKYIVTAKDRFEFNTKTNIVVIRGKPHLKSKNSSPSGNNIEGGKGYDVRAGLAYAKLTPNSNNIEYAEIFDNIVIKSNDGSTIYADYGYFDYPKDILYLEDNVKMIDNENNVIESCKLILDVASGKTKLVKCDDQSKFYATINKTRDKEKTK